MRTFTLKIKGGNEAMRRPADVAAALRVVADAVERNLADTGSIRDENGNRVGEWSLT